MVGDREWELLRAAEEAGFDVMLSADQSMVYQHSGRERRIALVVLNTNNWTLIRPKIDVIRLALAEATPGSFAMVKFKEI